jgi:hypothetical protein
MSVSRVLGCMTGLTAISLLLGGCDDPTLPRRPPDSTALRVFLIIDPDRATHPLLVQPSGAGGVLDQLEGKVFVGNQLVASATGQADWNNEFIPCADRYGSLDGTAFPRCLDFQFAPQPGTTYRVVVGAENHLTASASVRIPNDFEVTSVIAQGDPPGTQTLKVQWTRSEGAHRYVVAVRQETAPRCVRISDCDQGWFVVTEDTIIDTIVPEEEVGGGEGSWFVDVYAMDKAVYEYLMTGTTGDLFPVPPVQNVEDGYGAVGAWVRRSVLIQP